MSTPGRRARLAFHGAALTVVGLGMLSLGSTGLLSPIALVVGLPACLLVAVDLRRWSVPNAVWNVVGVAALVGAGYAYYVLHYPLLTVMAHVTVFIQVYRLLVRTNARGYHINFLLAFAQLLLAAILTIELSFLLVFVAFAVALVWALLLLQLREAEQRQLEGGPVPTRGSADALLGPLYLAYATSMTVALLVGTGAIFLVMPRLQIGLAEGFATPVSVSGFSEEVRLGDVGLIQRNDAPVMRVRVRDARGEPVMTPLYYHGLALDDFDGHRWQLTDATTVQLINQQFGRLDDDPPPQGTTLSQHFVLEPINSRVVFYVRTPLSLRVPLHRLEAASTEGYFFPSGTDRPEYDVHSWIVRPSPEEFRAASTELPPDIAARYLQVPELADRVVDLAGRWIAMGGTVYDGALVVQQRLSEEFVYSLDQPSAGQPDPIDHFLFESREGHCEFFATAMAVMLRSQGIPTRLVNGFHGGEYNPAGEYFIVRQNHAHSWVEVYFPDLGWQIFDPTPVGALDDAAQLLLGSRLRGWLDLAGLRWRTLVLDYDQAAQLGAIQRARRGLGSSDPLGLPSLSLPRLNTADGRVDPDARGITVALALAAVLALLLAVAGAIRRRWLSEAPLRALHDGPSRRYVKLVRRSVERTRRRLAGAVPAHATPREVALRANAEHPAAARALLREVDRYYAVRFGGASASPVDVARARRLLRSSGRAAQRSRARSMARGRLDSDEEAVGGAERSR